MSKTNPVEQPIERPICGAGGVTECAAVEPAGVALPASSEADGAPQKSEADGGAGANLAAFVSRFFGGAPVAFDELRAALRGTEPQAVDGEDLQAPSFNSPAGALYWASRLACLTRRLPDSSEAPSTSPLRILRDAGNTAAGLLFDELGDGFALPDLPLEVIDAAAVFAVDYMSYQTSRKREERTLYRDNPFKSGFFAENVTDLFLRCVGKRRALEDGPTGRRFNQEALFFRKIHDLGGLG